MKKAVGYCRFSTDMQRTESIDAQKRAITEFCNANNIEILKFYVDEGQTATSDARDNFQKMIKEVDDNIDYVIVHKFDRFARDKYDHYYYEHQLDLKGIKLISVLERFDDSPESGLLKSLIIGMNEYFSKNLAREVYKGMKENAMKAKFNGGKPPLGYDIDDNNNYIINQNEAKIVRLAFDLRRKGYSHQDIADTLNSLGHVNKKGKEFNRNSFTEMFKNEKYIGTYTFGLNDSSGKKRNYRKRNKPEKIIRLEDSIPAIIDKETFYEVQTATIANRPRGPKHRNYILSSLVKCGICGAPMLGSSRTNQLKRVYYYYRCNDRCGNTSIRAEILENEVISTLKNNLLTEKNIETIAKFAYQQHKELVEKMASGSSEQYTKELNSINKEINNLVVAISKSAAEALIDKLNSLEEEKEKLRLKIASINNMRVFDYQEIEDEMRKFLSFDDLNYSEKKALLRIFIKQITCKGNEVTITLKHIPQQNIAMCSKFRQEFPAPEL